MNVAYDPSYIDCDPIMQSEVIKDTLTDLANCINELSAYYHAVNIKMGWWTDKNTGQPKERNKGELLALIHSEISECLEGVRKNCPDDKLPHRKMEEVELADALLRIFDYAGAYKLDLAGAIAEKAAYNVNRADHKLENRNKPGGKEF